jgi:multidrug resistance efflux pump
MTIQPELFVDSLDVTEGQQVEKDQVLYTLNVAMLNEKIEAIEREIAKLVLQNEQAGSESAAEQEKRTRSINRATEAYNEAVSSGDSAIARAVEELNTAQNNLSGIDKTKENYEEEKNSLKQSLVTNNEAMKKHLRTRKRWSTKLGDHWNRSPIRQLLLQRSARHRRTLKKNNKRWKS